MRFNLSQYWYQSSAIHPLSLLLRPCSWLFEATALTRRWLYTTGVWRSKAFNVPIIVVGNITVGGTGKTPFVIWLAHLLQKQGFRPGIVSRGVGGIRHKKPHWVKQDDLPAFVGDEAKLLCEKTNCPLVICIDRVASVRDLLKQTQCNIVISDDGLQHYRLKRDIEIVIIDGQRGFGNGCLLPAGPLRERINRLSQVDFVIVNGQDVLQTKNGWVGEVSQKIYQMLLEPIHLQSMTNHQSMPLAAFPNRTIHAVSGIGNPDRFHTMLAQAKFNIIPHIFPDHYLFKAKDLHFNDDLPVIMTEKDAVKCTSFARDHWWFVEVIANVEKNLEEKLLLQIRKLPLIQCQKI